MNDYINDVTFENSISTLVWSPIKNLNAWELVFHTLARSSSLRTQTVGFKLKPKTRTFPIEISANLECPRNVECRESILWMARWQSNELVLVRPPPWNVSTTIWSPPPFGVHHFYMSTKKIFSTSTVLFSRWYLSFHSTILDCKLLIRKRVAWGESVCLECFEANIWCPRVLVSIFGLWCLGVWYIGFQFS